MIESLPGTTLGIISGASDHLEVANLKHFQKLKLIRHLYKLPADYVILDLGAGTTYNTLDFFNIADQGILSVIPEPTSIENSHRFLKSAMYRKLRDVPTDTKEIVKEILGTPTEQTRSLNTLNKIIASIHQKSAKHGKILRKKLFFTLTLIRKKLFITLEVFIRRIGQVCRWIIQRRITQQRRRWRQPAHAAAGRGRAAVRTGDAQGDRGGRGRNGSEPARTVGQAAHRAATVCAGRRYRSGRTGNAAI